MAFAQHGFYLHYKKLVTIAEVSARTSGSNNGTESYFPLIVEMSEAVIKPKKLGAHLITMQNTQLKLNSELSSAFS